MTIRETLALGPDSIVTLNRLSGETADAAVPAAERAPGADPADVATARHG
jgi:hypothetical protein